MAQKSKPLEYVTLTTFNTRVEAEVLKGYLKAQSIKAIISADDEGGSAPFPFQPSSTGVKVMVPTQSKSLAKKLVGEKPSLSKKASVNKPLLFILILLLGYYFYLFIKDF